MSWSRQTGAVRLLLMRHAKSDYPLGVVDHDRPLNDHGRSDARAAGSWLTCQGTALLGEQPLVLVSTARRTQQTWDIAGAGLGLAASVESRLYQASERTYLEVLREGLMHADTLLVVAHNPATEDVARLLAASGANPQAHAMWRKFPTSAIAVIDLPEGHLEFAAGELVAFEVPRGTMPDAVG